METVFNGKSYAVSHENGLTTFTHDRGSFSSGGSVKEVYLNYLVRPERDRLLSECDWRMVSDYPYDDQDEWKEYRSKLRDIADTYNELSVVWPEEPLGR